MKNPSLQSALDNVIKPDRNFAAIVEQFANEYCRKARGTFTSEDIREAYELSGNPVPADWRVLGAAMTRLKQNNLIQSEGYVTYRGKQGHCRPSTLWRSVLHFEQFEAKELIGRQAKLF